MKTITEKLELMASHCTDRDEYDKTLIRLLAHCKLIVIAKADDERILMLGMLHDMFAECSKCAMFTVEQDMFELAEHIAYYTGQESYLPLAEPIKLPYTVVNAILHINAQRVKIKIIAEANDI